MNEGGNDSTEFMRHLQDEKLKTQAARSKYVTQKLAYATGLLALGSLKPGSADLSLLLYLVPLLSIVFDLYILGEDYSVKRIGAFLGAASTDRMENVWEDWVSRHRDPFAPIAVPVLTSLLAIAVSFGVLSQPPDSYAKKWWWLLVVPLVAIAFTWWLFKFYKKKTVTAKKSVAKAVNDAKLDAMKNATKATEERSKH